MSTSSTRGRSGTSASGIQRASSVLPSTSWRSSPPTIVEDHPDPSEPAASGNGSLLRRDHDRGHTDHPAELHVVAGLLAELPDRALLDALVQLDTTAGQRPQRLIGLVPQGEKHPVAVVDNQGVRRQPGLVLGVVQQRCGHGSTLAGGMNAARVGYGQV
jgi:hypothetical protein